MIPKNAVIRIARPTDHLEALSRMYIEGLGFTILSSFEDHDGFFGTIIGHPNHNYHIEFTHQKGVAVGKAPTEDNLLIFYLPEEDKWLDCCKSLLEAGFIEVKACNPYWDISGKTFEDLDGYRVVLQKGTWTI